MKNELITDSEAQRAWDFIRDNVEPFAEACAHRIYIEEYRKSLKAIIMKEHAELLIGAQEREAYADERYVKHIEALKEAVFNEERLRHLSDAAKIKVGAWQTVCANNQ